MLSVLSITIQAEVLFLSLNNVSLTVICSLTRGARFLSLFLYEHSPAFPLSSLWDTFWSAGQDWKDTRISYNFLFKENGLLLLMVSIPGILCKIWIAACFTLLRNNTNECEHVSLTLSAESASGPEARGWTRGVHSMACPAVLVFPSLPSAVSLFQLSFVSDRIDKTNMNNHSYTLFRNKQLLHEKVYIYISPRLRHLIQIRITSI